MHLHPGGDYQCRCCALARFDEVIAELEGANEPLEPVPEEVRSVGKIGGYDFVKAGLADGERRAFADDLGRVSKEHLKTLEKYAQDMQADFHYAPKSPTDAPAYHSPSEKKIYLDITKTDARDAALGYKTHMTGFLHESGHWLDWNMLGSGGTVRASLPDLRKKLEADLLTSCNNVLKSNRVITRVKTVDEMLQNENVVWFMNDDLMKSPDIKHSVSDLFGGMTNNVLNNGYRHPVDYWSGDALEREAMAHFFEARGSGGKKLETLKAYFPTAYKYFDDFIKGAQK